MQETSENVKKHRLSTVCEEAKCPNRMECYSNHTATYLVLGNSCTRACGFCDIDFTKAPLAPDLDEPKRVAQSAKALGLKHIVITMVARDDLEDGGASHIASVIDALREEIEGATIEVLTSDLMGNTRAIDIILQKKPEIFNHNIETVRRLSPRVRHRATYDRTLAFLQYVAKSPNPPFVKSGLMVGLGETDKEVEKTILDLADAGCSIITIGQYLQASRLKLKVQSFVTPLQFKHYEKFGLANGIKHMYSGPFVRSSYNAHLVMEMIK